MARAPRPNPFAIRIPTAKRTGYQERAERAGLSLGAFFMAAADGPNAPAPRRVRQPTADRAELARIMAQLGKLGSNVNQLAHQANAGSWPDRRSLDEAAADIRVMRDAVLTALGMTPPPAAANTPPAGAPR